MVTWLKKQPKSKLWGTGLHLLMPQFISIEANREILTIPTALSIQGVTIPRTTSPR